MRHAGRRLLQRERAWCRNGTAGEPADHASMACVGSMVAGHLDMLATEEQPVGGSSRVVPDHQGIYVSDSCPLHDHGGSQ